MAQRAELAATPPGVVADAVGPRDLRDPGSCGGAGCGVLVARQARATGPARPLHAAYRLPVHPPVDPWVPRAHARPDGRLAAAQLHEMERAGSHAVGGG